MGQELDREGFPGKVTCGQIRARSSSRVRRGAFEAAGLQVQRPCGGEIWLVGGTGRRSAGWPGGGRQAMQCAFQLQ